MEEERRKHTRYPSSYKIVYWPSEEITDEEGVETTSFNISLGGIGINVNTLLKESTKIKIKIYNPETGVPVDAEGIIVWKKIEKVPEQKSKIGLKFLRIGWTQIKALLTAVTMAK